MACFLCAHGAGAPSTHPWMQGWARRLAALGPVRTFDYPYMRAGRRAPDRMPKLLEAHRSELAALRAEHPQEKVVLVGKSMGSRVGCHLSLEEPVAGLVCLGFPLRSMGKNPKLRNEVLEALTTPVLFVQGTRDNMGPLDVFADVRQRMQVTSVLHVVQSGNHSLEITKTHQKQTGEDQDAVDARILEAIAAFVGTL